MRLLHLLICLIIFNSCTKDRIIEKEPIILQDGEILIHYWNFNTDDTSEDIIKPTITETTTAINFYLNEGELPFCEGNNQSCWETVNDGTIENTQVESEAGKALRLRNPCSYLDINASTVGFGDLLVSYVMKRTGSGAQKNRVQYTTDGSIYSSLGLAENEFTISEEYTLIELNLSDVQGVNNNPNFGIRITFEDGNTNSSGNNRMDNLTFIGKSF